MKLVRGEGEAGREVVVVMAEVHMGVVVKVVGTWW